MLRLSGTKIRAARFKAGLTRQDVADILGTCAQSICQLELDKLMFPLKHNEQLATIYKVPLSELMEEAPAEYTTKCLCCNKEIVNNYNNKYCGRGCKAAHYTSLEPKPKVVPKKKVEIIPDFNDNVYEVGYK